MYKVALGVCVLWVGCVGVVLASSDQLCSNGGSYGAGGCCGDGVVQSYGGEECDNGLYLNGYPEGARRKQQDIHACFANCALDHTHSNQSLFFQSPCYGGYGDLYPFWTPADPLKCVWGNLVRPTYSDSHVVSNGAYRCIAQTISAQVCGGAWLSKCGATSNTCDVGYPQGFDGNNRSCLNPGGGTAYCPTNSGPSCTNTNGGVEICGDGIDQDCNGSDLSCPPCTNPIAGASACPGTPAPTADTPYTLVSSCQGAGTCTATCISPKIPSGNDCVDPPSQDQYVCGSDGNRTGNGNCPTLSPDYNSSNTNPGYPAGTTKCFLESAGAPSNDTCRDPNGACNIASFSCNIGTKNNDNNLTGPGQTRQWYCDATLCEYTYLGSDPGICGSSYYSCLSAAGPTNGDGSHRTCPGSNGGADASCCVGAEIHYRLDCSNFNLQ